MDKTEKEFAEFGGSKSSGTQSTKPDANHNQLNVKSSEKALTDTESDGLEHEDADAESANSDTITAQSPQNDGPDSTESEQTNDLDDRADHLPDELDAQASGDTGKEESDQSIKRGVLEAKADEALSAADESGQKADQNEMDQAEAPTTAEVEADSDQTQSASKEASIPQAQAETQSGADEAVSAAAAPDDQRTEDPEDSDLETAEHAPDAVTPKTPIVKIAVSAVLITAVFSGFFFFENKSKITKDQTVTETLPEDQPQPLRVEAKQIVEISSAVSPSIYDDPINEVSILRDTLLIKRSEVLALIKRYRQSIEELEKEILDAQREADVQTFLQATNHKRIVFSLKTIQRRQAYIRQLQKPLEWVSSACEELLYLKRRVMTDLQVSAIAGGIDMDRHVQQMHRALKEYRPTADKLAIDPTDARLESLETIWQRVQQKQDVVSAEPVYSKNQMISAQICAGDFNRVGELSEMTTKTARCITEMQASDLFLNQITEITPAAARQLCEWKGSWLCMNGVRALSPRVAHYLFQWDGHWISLNGLTEFPAEIGEALLRWQGRQLELMGLLDTDDAHARIGIENLAAWERSGGKLFVPENLRKKIDALHQGSG